MPWTAEYLSDGAEIRYSGVLTGAEIIQAKKEFFAHPFATPPRWVVCDFSQVAEFKIARNEIDQIIRQDLRAAAANPALAEGVIAVKPYEYGLARMWEMQVDSAEKRTIVAKSRAQVDAWMRDHGIIREEKPAD